MLKDRTLFKNVSVKAKEKTKFVRKKSPKYLFFFTGLVYVII